MLKPGDVILAKMQFANSYEIKTRPALVLFEELDNIIVAGITSNPKMQGIPITIQEGAVKPSVIKLNYIFTVSRTMLSKTLFRLNQTKRKRVFDELVKKLGAISR